MKIFYIIDNEINKMIQSTIYFVIKSIVKEKNMDEIIKKLAALGVPGIVLLTAMSATRYAGGAAMTSALAALGPFGMAGGIVMLGSIALLSDKITEIGFEKVTIMVIKEQLKTISKSEMKNKVKKMPITKGMKLKVIDFIEKSDDL